jgi:Leucine-rich repeat (LRR) protein
MKLIKLVAFFMIVTVTSVSLVLSQSNYPEDLIKQAQDRRESWWKAQEDKIQANKKRAYLQLMNNMPHHETPIMATNPNDKQAIERFYASTNGPQWSNNSGWMKGDPCMDYWYGLYCSETGRILQINLVYNLLSGSIPSDIASLDQLQVLRLYSNNIGGTLPPQLFSMNSLQELDLDFNQITGPLPSTIDMANITIMNLYSNGLSGNIPQQWKTPKLTTLTLSSNKFQGSLPPSIGDIETLEVFVASINSLTGTFPEEYGRLKNLQQLWLFSNYFEEPHIPQSWSGMTSMLNLEIDGVTGDIPNYIGTSWQNIENLVIVDGHLTGQLPSSLCNLKKVQYIHLYNNSLKGSIPECMCELPPSVLSLELSDNMLIGPIPDCIGSNLHNLTEFYMSRNNLSGELPRSLGNCKVLEVIDVSSNGLYGSIPSSYSGLVTEFSQLSVCYNKMSSIDEGLEAMFNHVKDYSCLLYNNPWDCPLPSFVPKECQASCSYCNSGDKHKSCGTCVSDSKCGWCNEGNNCLGGSFNGPDDYSCQSKDWIYNYSSHAHC